MVRITLARNAMPRVAVDLIASAGVPPARRSGIASTRRSHTLLEVDLAQELGVLLELRRPFGRELLQTACLLRDVVDEPVSDEPDRGETGEHDQEDRQDARQHPGKQLDEWVDERRYGTGRQHPADNALRAQRDLEDEGRQTEREDEHDRRTQRQVHQRGVYARCPVRVRHRPYDTDVADRDSAPTAAEGSPPTTATIADVDPHSAIPLSIAFADTRDHGLAGAVDPPHDHGHCDRGARSRWH